MSEIESAAWMRVQQNKGPQVLVPKMFTLHTPRHLNRKTVNRYEAVQSSQKKSWGSYGLEFDVGRQKLPAQ